MLILMSIFLKSQLDINMTNKTDILEKLNDVKDYLSDIDTPSELLVDIPELLEDQLISNLVHLDEIIDFIEENVEA